MTVHNVLVEQTATATWASPAAGLWVATAARNRRGMVERTEDGYVATNAQGRVVGVFPDFAGACDAVEGFRAQWRNHSETVVLKATFALAGLTAALLAVAVFLVTRF